MISGGIAGEHEQITTPQLTRDEMAAAISTAHAWGRKVTAHAGPASVIAEAVELGLDCVEHGYELTPEVAALMAEHEVALVPTLVVTRAGAFFDELGVPAWMQERSLGAGDRHLQSYRYALDAGVDVLLGSDMPPFWAFEGTSAAVRELEHMEAGGLDSAAAIRAATSRPATWLGAGDELGALRPGLRGRPHRDARRPHRGGARAARHRPRDEGGRDRSRRCGSRGRSRPPLLSRCLAAAGHGAARAPSGRSPAPPGGSPRRVKASPRSAAQASLASFQSRAPTLKASAWPGQPR